MWHNIRQLMFLHYEHNFEQHGYSWFDIYGFYVPLIFTDSRQSRWSRNSTVAVDGLKQCLAICKFATLESCQTALAGISYMDSNLICMDFHTGDGG
eukprot:c17924_g3_i2 orf=298-585(-)